MEKSKKVGYSSSSSSFTMDLFGPKDSSNNSSSTNNEAASLFSSIFGPPNTAPNRDASPADPRSAYGNYNKMKTKDYINEKGNTTKNDRESNNYNDQNGTASCYFNSSIYYGGQEVYSPTNHNTSPSRNLKKDGENDTDDGNSNCASRGNWWQGSLYY